MNKLEKLGLITLMDHRGLCSAPNEWILKSKAASVQELWESCDNVTWLLDLIDAFEVSVKLQDAIFYKVTSYCFQQLADHAGWNSATGRFSMLLEDKIKGKRVDFNKVRYQDLDSYSEGLRNIHCQIYNYRECDEPAIECLDAVIRDTELGLPAVRADKLVSVLLPTLIREALEWQYMESKLNRALAKVLVM